MVHAFPVIKLVSLLARQVSRPIANQLKNGAKRNYTFRRFVCLPIAQLEITRKMIMIGFGKPVTIPELNEEAAVELGADILGEMVVYAIAVFVVAFEYMRSNEKARIKEEELQQRLENIESSLKEFRADSQKQYAELQALQNLTQSVLWKSKKRDVTFSNNNENISDGVFQLPVFTRSSFGLTVPDKFYTGM
ncbi:Optic atrophy 3 -like protein [Trichinella papuae]|uniref:Optic atrophy 3-like protein n=1 Tax=Trichinella papuae TaxID=268474 RepID=A0A0V1N452_9BILA|nr:Optic atrophy 3 -like protein [Trichinella papuae]KRZ78824.1 Optic atrophy 3 -like protein [Trichinella papuae]